MIQPDSKINNISIQRDDYSFGKEEDITLEKNMFYVIQNKLLNNDDLWLKNNQDIILYCLQNTLVSFLNSFLHGSFLTKKSRLFYPWFLEYGSSILNQQVAKLQSLLHVLDRLGFNFTSSAQQLKLLLAKKKKKDLDIATFISVIYQDMESCFSKYLGDRQYNLQNIKIEPFNINLLCKDKNYLNPLKRIIKYLNEEIKDDLIGFYLHGSLATMDYVKGYSDVDTFMVIERTTMQSPYRLVKLRNNCLKLYKMFFSIDPIQHHGILAVTFFELNFFSQGYFPLVLFQYAKSLLKGKGHELKIIERDSKIDRNNLYWKMISTIRGWHQQDIKSPNMYELKSRCQYLLLTPIVFLQTKDIFLYKRDFFDKFRINKKDDLLNRISQMRNQWQKLVYQTKADFLKRKIISITFCIFNLFVGLKLTKGLIYSKVPSLISRLIKQSEVKNFVFYAEDYIAKIEQNL